MEPTKAYPIVAVLSLVTVEYGGWALLSFVTARRGQLDDLQTQFFRAGHAHAGVLLVLSLVYFLYLGSKTDFAESTQWVAGAILLAGILAQSGGFFLHLAVGEAGRGSVGTRLTRSGARRVPPPPRSRRAGYLPAALDLTTRQIAGPGQRVSSPLSRSRVV